MKRSLEAVAQVAYAEHSDTSHAVSGDVCCPTSLEKDVRRVLIVDDEQNILSSLRRLLRNESYELVTSGSGEEALRAMKERPANVVISDYRMPGMVGTDLLREIQNRWPDTVRIVLSGYSEVSAIINAINEGSIYKFITKPWNDEEILLNIRRAVEQYELVVENRRMAGEISQQNEQLRELNRRLDRRAADASDGQTLAQELLESIHAGLMIVDPNGLIVTANCRVWYILQLGETELIGLPAQKALPSSLHNVFAQSVGAGDAFSKGRVEVKGKTIEWRVGMIGESGDKRGAIMTLWEEVQ